MRTTGMAGIVLFLTMLVASPCLSQSHLVGAREPFSLLDEVGKLRRTIAPAEAEGWKQALHASGRQGVGDALLHLHLAEWEFACNEQPGMALWHLYRAESLSAPSNPIHGCSRYNQAIVWFYRGAYKKAVSAFTRLLAPQRVLRGYSRASCALWLRQANACAGYHAQRRNLGIREPEQLDPLCGVEALAACLQHLGLPFDKGNLLANCRVTGLGSTLADLRAGAAKLGAATVVAKADKQGLIGLPKPMVAYVEHDHFVALLRADASGVSYLCSDCGPWPGGRRDVTWKQWRAMDPGFLLVVTCPEIAVSRASAATETLSDRSKSGLRLTSVTPPIPPQEGFLSRLMTLLRGHVLLYTGTPTTKCGTHVQTMHPPADLCTPTDGSGGGASGPAKPDPVNLATGEEEYKPGPDLVVYNPLGPSVVWTRLYNSLRSDVNTFYELNDFGAGWSQNYNVKVVFDTTNVQVQFLYPNGAVTVFSADKVPDASTPEVLCAPIMTGARMFGLWNYSSAGYTFTIVHRDRTKWVFSTPDGRGAYNLSSLVDRTGHAIQFLYGEIGPSGYRLLSAIQNSAGTNLLTITRNPGRAGAITTVSDCYGRSVYYQVIPFDNIGVPGDGTQWPLLSWELTQVSQITATGTSNPPLRFKYGYVYVGTGEPGEGVPGLASITVPSPTGTGTSVSHIVYDRNGIYVATTVDANGMKRTYSPTQTYATQVTVRDPLGHTVYRYSVTFDAHLRELMRTDGSLVNQVQVQSFASDNSMKPNAVVDGNGRRTTYQYDAWGNLIEKTTPRGVTTVYSYDYSNPDFPPGELKAIQEKTSTAAKSPITLSYFEPSGLVKEIDAPAPGSVNGPSVAYTFTYNDRGDVRTVTTPGNGAASQITYTYSYDTDGSYQPPVVSDRPLAVTDNLGHTTHFRYEDGRGNLTTVLDALGNRTDFQYDIADHLVKRIWPTTTNGRAYRLWNYLYPGGPLTAVTDYDDKGAQANQTVWNYGPEGEVRSVSGSVTPVSYVYDAAYRVVQQIDGQNHATRFEFNTLGYLARTTFPNGDSLQFPVYDGAGRPLVRIDGRGIRTLFVYNDSDGRLTNVLYQDAPHYSGLSRYNTGFHYDAFGRSDIRTDSTGTVHFAYDDRNTLLSTSTTYLTASGGTLPAKKIAYTFYPNGARQTIVTPAGTFHYDYDPAGWLTTVTDPQGKATAYGYYDNGLLAYRQLANGVKTTYTYNPRGFLSEMAHVTATGAVLADFASMTYDGVGNRLSMTVTPTAAVAGRTDYTYDTRNQLRQETTTRGSGYNYLFDYDDSGNPVTFKGSGHTFDADNHLANLSYDGNGNPTTYQSSALSFDPENNLLTCGTGFVAAYQTSGLRAWKEEAGTRTYFLYDGILPVCELSATGVVVAANTFSKNGLVSRHTSAGTVFYAFDPQGSVIQRLDATGKVTSSQQWDAYGGSKTVPPDPFGFGAQWGYYTDRKTGLQLLGLRYYAPDQGRFLNRDPIGYAGGVNLYGYVRNRPTRLVDPSGTKPWWVKGIDATNKGYGYGSDTVDLSSGGKDPSQIAGSHVGSYAIEEIAGGEAGATVGGEIGGAIGAIIGGAATLPTGGEGAIPGAIIGASAGTLVGGVIVPMVLDFLGDKLELGDQIAQLITGTPTAGPEDDEIGSEPREGCGAAVPHQLPGAYIYSDPAYQLPGWNLNASP